MSYSNSNPQNYTSSANSPELKLYQAFIFTVPICFTFIILFVFYIIYLRRRSSSSADLSSLGVRTTFLIGNNSISTAELGLSKELREMLPIVVFKESFSVLDSLCSVCLGDYQADEKLQQIPSCGHTFHMDCIDLWLTSHTTCPLCRLTLIPTHSNQTQEEDPPVPNLRAPDDGGVSSSQPETQPEDHGNYGHCDLNESDRDAENSKETQEDERNSIGTSANSRKAPLLGRSNKEGKDHANTIRGIELEEQLKYNGRGNVTTCSNAKSEQRMFQEENDLMVLRALKGSGAVK